MPGFWGSSKILVIGFFGGLPFIYKTGSVRNSLLDETNDGLNLLLVAF